MLYVALREVRAIRQQRRRSAALLPLFTLMMPLICRMLSAIIAYLRCHAALCFADADDDADAAIRFRQRFTRFLYFSPLLSLMPRRFYFAPPA